MIKILEATLGVLLLGCICFGGICAIRYKDAMRGLKEGRVYDLDGNAYYCKIGENSKKRLELLKQAEKLKE